MIWQFITVISIHSDAKTSERTINKSIKVLGTKKFESLFGGICFPRNNLANQSPPSDLLKRRHIDERMHEPNIGITLTQFLGSRRSVAATDGRYSTVELLCVVHNMCVLE